MSQNHDADPNTLKAIFEQKDSDKNQHSFAFGDSLGTRVSFITLFKCAVTVVLNLFRAVAHFKQPQISVGRIQNNFDVTITMSLE